MLEDVVEDVLEDVVEDVAEGTPGVGFDANGPGKHARDHRQDDMPGRSDAEATL